jgi:hypothetical protein
VLIEYIFYFPFNFLIDLFRRLGKIGVKTLSLSLIVVFVRTVAQKKLVSSGGESEAGFFAARSIPDQN